MTETNVKVQTVASCVLVLAACAPASESNPSRDAYEIAAQHCRDIAKIKVSQTLGPGGRLGSQSVTTDLGIDRAAYARCMDLSGYSASNESK